MNNNRQQIIKLLDETGETLQEIFIMLQSENKNGNQFDYCTSSTLSNGFDYVQELTKKIDRIIYQQ